MFDFQFFFLLPLYPSVCLSHTLHAHLVVVYMFIKYSLTAHSSTPCTERFTCCEGEFEPITPHGRYSIASGIGATLHEVMFIHIVRICVAWANPLTTEGNFSTAMNVWRADNAHTKTHIYIQMSVCDLFVFGVSVCQLCAVCCVNISTARCDGMYVTVVAVISLV